MAQPALKTQQQIAVPTGPTAARNVLIETHLELVHDVARTIQRSYWGIAPDLDDLVALGLDGLIQAAERYRTDLGRSFASYSFWRIRGAILDGLRETGWYVRDDVVRVDPMVVLKPIDPIHASAEEGCARSDDAAHMIDEAPRPDEAVDRKQIESKVREALTALPDDQRAVVEAYYFENRTFEEIGATLALSKSWVCRLHARAVRKLKVLVAARASF